MAEVINNLRTAIAVENYSQTQASCIWRSVTEQTTAVWGEKILFAK
jgi:hypothetical protein